MGTSWISGVVIGSIIAVAVVAIASIAVIVFVFVKPSTKSTKAESHVFLVCSNNPVRVVYNVLQN